MSVDMERLKSVIVEIREGIREGHYPDEENVKLGIVVRLLTALGWSVYPPFVCAEYGVGGKRVDYALRPRPSKRAVFVEVKKIGSLQGEDQLLGYAFEEGVPLAVLTTGQEWSFYLPLAEGRYSERRVYKLDLLERDVDDCTARLTRYLSFDRVSSEEALTAAKEDHRAVARERDIMAALPLAWAKLIRERNERLVSLLAESVEDLCGFTPEHDAVITFLIDRIRLIEDHSESAERSSRVSREPSDNSQRRYPTSDQTEPNPTNDKPRVPRISEFVVRYNHNYAKPIGGGGRAAIRILNDGYGSIGEMRELVDLLEQNWPDRLLKDESKRCGYRWIEAHARKRS